MSADIELLQTEGLPATSYARALDAILDKDWPYWEYRTIWSEILEETGLVLSDAVQNKIRAYKACLNSTMPFFYWSIFLHVCAAFNDLDVDPMVARTFTPPQLLWTMELMQDINPEGEFSFDVLGMISVLLFDSGIRWLPSPYGDVLNDRLEMLSKDKDGELISQVESAYGVGGSLMGVDPEDASVVEIAVSRIIPIINYIETNRKLEEGAKL